MAAQYAKLSDADARALVVDDKWIASLSDGVEAELMRMAQALTRRIKSLAERYASPLSSLDDAVARLEAKVAEHLARMGFV